MASEENIGKLHRIAQLGNDEVIEYENFRETLLKSIDKELDVDQVMIKMLEVSEGQSLGTYKNGVFIFSTDIMKSAEKLVHEENRRIPGTKEYEMAHQNDKLATEQEDLSALPMIEQCKRFVELSYEQRQEIISIFTDLKLEEQIVTIESLRGEVELLREIGAVPEPILDESEYELSMSSFLTYKLAFQDEKDPIKRAELLEKAEMEAKTFVGYCLEKLKNKDSLSEEEYKKTLIELAKMVGESLEDVEAALALEEAIEPADWIAQAVYNVKREDINQKFIMQLSEDETYEGKAPAIRKEEIEQMKKSFKDSRTFEQERIKLGLTFASNVAELSRMQGNPEVTVDESDSKYDGEKALGNTEELPSKDNVSTSERAMGVTLRLNECRNRAFGLSARMLEGFNDVRNIYKWDRNFEEQMYPSRPQTRLGKFFDKREQEKREEVVAEKVQRNFLLENEQLTQEGEQLRKKISVDITGESYKATKAALGQIFSTSKPGLNIPPITDAEMSRKKGILSEDLIVGDATIPEIISNDIVGKITPEPIAPEIVTPEPAVPEVVSPEPIVAEELNIEDEKINQGVEPVTQSDASENLLPKDVTLSDKMKRGFFNIGKKLREVAKAIVSQDKSKGLFTRIAEALNDSDTSNADTTGTTSTSSSAGPVVENKFGQAPVDYLNTQFKLDFKQASQEAKAAEAKAAQSKEEARDLTQEEDQL